MCEDVFPMFSCIISPLSSTLRLPLQRGVPVVYWSSWSDLPGVWPHQAGRGWGAGDALQADEGPWVPDSPHPQQGWQSLHPGLDEGLRGPVLEHGAADQRHRAPSGLCQLLLASGLCCRHKPRALHEGGDFSAGWPQPGMNFLSCFCSQYDSLGLDITSTYLKKHQAH